MQDRSNEPYLPPIHDAPDHAQPAGPEIPQPPLSAYEDGNPGSPDPDAAWIESDVRKTLAQHPGSQSGAPAPQSVPPPLPPYNPGSRPREPLAGGLTPLDDSLLRLSNMVRSGHRHERALVCTFHAIISSVNLACNAVAQLEPDDWERLRPIAREMLVASLELSARLEPVCHPQPVTESSAQ